MSLHSDTLFWFRASQSALSPKCCMLSGEATHTNFIVFGLTQPGLKPTIYCTRGEHANNYAIVAVVRSRPHIRYYINWYFTGVDPIQEAIVEYNRARQGNALPPDIYLGLRFGDADEKPTSDMTPKGKVSMIYRPIYCLTLFYPAIAWFWVLFNIGGQINFSVNRSWT